MNTRTKGRVFEKEVADLWAQAGFSVRGLEAGGDHLVIRRDGLVLASECKRRERLAIPEWWRQTATDAPAGAIPVLTFKQNRGEALSLLRAADLVRLIAAALEKGADANPAEGEAA